MSTEVIWNQYSSSVLQYFKSKLGNSDLAEDLRQEVFVKVHSNLDRIRSDEKVRHWLSVISRNVLVDFWKSEGRMRELDAFFLENGSSDFFGEAADQCVTNMIRKMPIEYGEPLRLSEIEGMKQREVAERLGLSLSGAKSRIQRGKVMLRKSITTCCHIELNKRNELVDGACHNPNCDCSS